MIKLSKVLSEARVSDPKEPLWNTYRIHAVDLDMNGYTVSILPQSQVLGSVISKVLDLKKRGGVVPTTNTSNDGYMYRYILKLSDELANDPKAIKAKFTVETLSPDLMPKAQAEQLKRTTAKSDINSFKNKGASTSSKTAPASTPVMPGKTKTKTLRSLATELYTDENLQYYEEDGTIMYDPYAYKMLMASDLPDSLKADLRSINTDMSTTIDPMTGETIPYGNRIIPPTSKIYKTLFTFKDAFKP